MKEAADKFVALIQDESGQDLIEYALVAGLIGLAAAAAMTGFAGSIGNSFYAVGNSIASSV